jgi:hypothetical protein
VTPSLVNLDSRLVETLTFRPWWKHKHHDLEIECFDKARVTDKTYI